MSSLTESWATMDLVHETIWETLDKMKSRDPIKMNTKNDSRCLICGHIYYQRVVELCPKCGGLCRIMPPDELGLSGRWPVDGW